MCNKPEAFTIAKLTQYRVQKPSIIFYPYYSAFHKALEYHVWHSIAFKEILSPYVEDIRRQHHEAL